MSWNYTSRRLKSSLDNIANLKKFGKDFWVVLDLNENTPPLETHKLDTFSLKESYLNPNQSFYFLGIVEFFSPRT